MSDLNLPKRQSETEPGGNQSGYGGSLSGPDWSNWTDKMNQPWYSRTGGPNQYGFYPQLPEGRDAPMAYYEAQRRVAEENAKLRQSAVTSLRQGLGNLQTYRPGGAAAMASPFYGQLADVYMRSQQEAPESTLYFAYQDAARKARRDARKAGYIQAGATVLGAALGAFAGPAGVLAGGAIGGALGSGLTAGDTGFLNQGLGGINQEMGGDYWPAGDTGGGLNVTPYAGQMDLSGPGNVFQGANLQTQPGILNVGGGKPYPSGPQGPPIGPQPQGPPIGPEVRYPPRVEPGGSGGDGGSPPGGVGPRQQTPGGAAGQFMQGAAQGGISQGPPTDAYGQVGHGWAQAIAGDLAADVGVSPMDLVMMAYEVEPDLYMTDSLDQALWRIENLRNSYA